MHMQWSLLLFSLSIVLPTAFLSPLATQETTGFRRCDGISLDNQLLACHIPSQDAQKIALWSLPIFPSFHTTSSTIHNTNIAIMKKSIVVTATLLLGITPSTTLAVNSADSGYLDRFTYQEEDITRPDDFKDYSPEHWNDISCNEGSRLDECLGYRDKWETGRDWEISKNYCRWCPEGEGRCGRHHQSPINLRREVGYEPGTHEAANECIGTSQPKMSDLGVGYNIL